MKQRFGLVHRPWGVFYLKDKTTGQQTSLKTENKIEAQRLLQAKNEAEVMPALNLQIARAYLSATDPGMRTRTWQKVMAIMGDSKKGSTLVRWHTAVKDEAFDSIRNVSLLETRPEHLLAVLKAGTVSTNVFLRRIHNFALDMDWLPRAVIPRRQWPSITFQPKRGITAEEHRKILAGEHNAEWRAFYELLWHVGGAQTDVAQLEAEDVDWVRRMISFTRQKTGSVVQLHFGEQVAALLRTLPVNGPLLPHIGAMKEGDRAKAFIRRCKLTGVTGVSLHCYRYAWAERALKCGYPERFAQQALGHNSKAVHHAYARHAEVTVPALDDWEKSFRTGTHAGGMEKPKLVPVDFQAQAATPNAIASAADAIGEARAG